MLFGTPGLPTEAKNVFDALSVLRRLGLDGMEHEFVRRVYLDEGTARALAKEKDGLFFTAHAPYYINLASEEKAKASLARIRLSAERLAAAGGASVVFHAGYYGKDPAAAHERILKNLAILREWEKELNIRIRPETAGKRTQWGSLEEVIAACEQTGLLPCIDFAHLHARAAGGFNTEEEFQRALDMLESRCGHEALKNMHIHLSGIEYSEKGERRHLPVRESDMNWRGLLKVLKEYGADGYLINESPNVEEDALLYKRFWVKL